MAGFRKHTKGFLLCLDTKISVLLFPFSQVGQYTQDER
jgi:hypothetical protein